MCPVPALVDIIKTRFFMVLSGRRNVAKTGENAPEIERPGQFVFDKKPIHARGYEQYEQSAGMDRRTLSSGRNMGR